LVPSLPYFLPPCLQQQEAFVQAAGFLSIPRHIIFFPSFLSAAKTIHGTSWIHQLKATTDHQSSSTDQSIDNLEAAVSFIRLNKRGIQSRQCTASEHQQQSDIKSFLLFSGNSQQWIHAPAFAAASSFNSRFLQLLPAILDFCSGFILWKSQILPSTSIYKLHIIRMQIRYP
jgi:hypothetical protein